MLKLNYFKLVCIESTTNFSCFFPPTMYHRQKYTTAIDLDDLSIIIYYRIINGLFMPNVFVGMNPLIYLLIMKL